MAQITRAKYFVFETHGKWFFFHMAPDGTTVVDAWVVKNKKDAMNQVMMFEANLYKTRGLCVGGIWGVKSGTKTKNLSKIKSVVRNKIRLRRSRVSEGEG